MNSVLNITTTISTDPVIWFTPSHFFAPLVFFGGVWEPFITFPNYFRFDLYIFINVVSKEVKVVFVNLLLCIKIYGPFFMWTFFQILHLLAWVLIAFIYIIKFNTKVFTVYFCYGARQKVNCKNIHNVLVKTFK